jgi:hypothetical protein
MVGRLYKNQTKDEAEKGGAAGRVRSVYFLWRTLLRVLPVRRCRAPGPEHLGILLRHGRDAEPQILHFQATFLSAFLCGGVCHRRPQTVPNRGGAKTAHLGDDVVPGAVFCTLGVRTRVTEHHKNTDIYKGTYAAPAQVADDAAGRSLRAAGLGVEARPALPHARGGRASEFTQGALELHAHSRKQIQSARGGGLAHCIGCVGFRGPPSATTSRRWMPSAAMVTALAWWPVFRYEGSRGWRP